MGDEWLLVGERQIGTSKRKRLVRIGVAVADDDLGDAVLAVERGEHPREHEYALRVYVRADGVLTSRPHAGALPVHELLGVVAAFAVDGLPAVRVGGLVGAWWPLKERSPELCRLVLRAQVAAEFERQHTDDGADAR